MQQTDLQAAVHAAAAARLAEARALSDFLASHPETAHREFQASANIAALLADSGFAVEKPYAGLETAFRAVYKNGDGPEIALLAEYDALPEIGHGCGHNLHGALSVLAALALTGSGVKERWRGAVHVIGTPAEETDGAKITMAARGVFTGLAAALMMHCGSGGASQADMDALFMRSYTFRFRGKPAHAAAEPWAGHSALAAARMCLTLIDANRECLPPGARINGIITSGGAAANVIPDYAELVVEFRAPDSAGIAFTEGVVLRCARAGADALACTEESGKNYDDFSGMARVAALEAEAERLFGVLGEPVRPPAPAAGSSDVGNVSRVCPAVQPLLSITDEPIALHTREFARATQTEAAYAKLALGAEALALLGFRVLTDGAFRAAVQADWERAVKGSAGT